MAKDVVLRITGDASGAVRALQQVTQSAAQAQGRLQKMQKNFQQYLLKTEIANRGLKSRSLINARADQLAAFERSHKFLIAQTQELYRQKYLNQQIAKSDTANWRQKLAARRQLLQLENKIAQAQQNNKKWANQYIAANKSWNNGKFYTGPISTPEQYAKAAPIPASVYAKQLGRSAMGHFSTGQNALFGAMGTAAMATGAIYSFMRFVEPGGDVAQLIKNIKSVTGNDVSDLATEVKRLGRTTPYTTRQVAQAAYTMSKAGYDAKSIREMISGSVYMGLATDTDPNAAADITAQTLSHFGLKANMARRVANLYSKAMVSSPAGLTDLAYTMQYAAPSALLAKTDFSTTLGMSGILARNGLKGSKAGTGLRGIFTNLAAPTKAANTSLQVLGIRTKDLKGNLRPITELFADLNKSLRKLPTAAKTAHLKNIFGKNAMGAASILIEKSGENNELVKYIQELREGDNANVAAIIAKQKQDSFQGDLASLSSAWEGVRIAVFDAVEEKLRSNAQGLTDLSLKTAEWINQNEKSVQQWFDIGKYIVAAIGSSAALQVAFGLCSYAAGGIKLVLAGVGTVTSGLVTVCEGIAAALGLSAAAGGALAFAVVAIPGAILLAIKYQNELLELQDKMIGKLDYLKIADYLTEGDPKNKLRKGTDSKREFLKLSPEEQEKALNLRTIDFLNAKYGRPQGTVPMINGKPMPDYREDNWYFQQIRQKILRQILRSERPEEKKARNKSEYEYMGTPEYAYQQRLKEWDKHRAEIEKQFGVSYGTAQLREQIAAAKLQRSTFDNALGSTQQKGQQAQVASAPAAVPGIGVQAGGATTEGQQAQVASAPTAPAAPAAPAITPEMLQTLAAQAKPANNTVTVGGTQVSVSVHCDASSIQTFVNQVVEAAKPQIDAIITAQVEKVKGALNSMGTGKKATAASML